jgi:hypothetical protein
MSISDFKRLYNREYKKRSRRASEVKETKEEVKK